jgi:hypothetical protein
MIDCTQFQIYSFIKGNYFAFNDKAATESYNRLDRTTYCDSNVLIRAGVLDIIYVFLYIATLVYPHMTQSDL